MKKIIIALTLAGILPLCANAQSAYAKNYPVCENNKGYHICGERPTFANATPAPGAVVYKDRYTVTSVPVTYYKVENPAPQSPNTYTSSTAFTSPDNVVEAYYTRHNIIYNDEARAPYEGLPSRQYDGPAKNEYRNLNTNQSSIDLPTNDGK